MSQERPLPEGLVTFLFTDIEGSTRRWETHPDAMEIAVARHDELLRAAIEGHGGYVFKTVGDAFCASFDEPTGAVAAVSEIQLGLADEPWGVVGPIRVRAALHVGTAEVRDRDYFGQDVNRVARLLSAGHGGQVLLSGAALELVRDRLPEGLVTRDLGTHRLKDLARPEHVHELLIPGLAHDFPPLRTLDARSHNLPVQLTTFVGREVELSALKRTLADHRLVTLTGIGGSGKSRLALQVAADLVHRFPDGVWLVELAAITDPDAVTLEVLSALGAREEAGRPPVETLVDELRGRSVLLILDNCEHLLQPCADLAADVLTRTEDVAILATSREGLAIPGEMIVAVPSLAVPGEEVHDTSVLSYPAVELLLDRARAVRPDLALTDEDLVAAGQIVRRLDGIPLAVELAAARVKVLSLAQIAARLDDRFRLLTGGSRNVLPRQQTLQAAMDWSYDLLTDRERTLLRRLAVFANGWTLGSAEAVCAGPDLDRSEVLDVLARLVDRSLVAVVEASSENRYRLLETVRQYGLERLADAGEVMAFRDEHERHFLGLVEELSPAARDGDIAALDRLEQDHDNIRAAIGWALERGSSEDALAFARSMGWFWFLRGDWSEAWELLGRAMDLAAAPSVLLARVHAWAAVFAWRRGDREATVACLDATDGVLSTHPDAEAHGISQLVRCLMATSELRHAEAEEHGREALRVFRSTGDPWGIAMSLTLFGQLMLHRGEDPGAVLEEAVALFDRSANPWGEAFATSLLARRALDSGDLDEAEDLYTRSARLTEEVGEHSGQVQNAMGLFHVRLLRGDVEGAAEEIAVAERLLDRLQDPHERMHVLEGVALLALARGERARAAELFRGTEEEMRASGHAGGMGALARSVAALYERYGHPRLAAGWLHHALELLDPDAHRKEVAQVLERVRAIAGRGDLAMDDALVTSARLAGLTEDGS